MTTLVRALVWPTVRAMRFRPLGGALGVALLVVLVPAVLGVATEFSLRPDDHANLLRLAAVCGALGLAFVFDDPAKPSTVAVPAPRWLPAAIRGVAGLAVFGGWWAAALGVTYAGAARAGGLRLPVPGLTLEVATVGALALAAGALSWRITARGVGGPVAAPASLGLVLAVAVAPVAPPMVVAASAPAATWGSVHGRWGALLALLVAAVVVACSLDRDAWAATRTILPASATGRHAADADPMPGDPALEDVVGDNVDRRGS
ncbi:hypothetical protein [Dactylosporangium sp. NPDC051541]|uniref:hypothetical protein n=1 Tax=Dactylosporangium sp. NPDC051541 TaxID=3363977 RepID=UPI00378806CE